MSEVARSFFKNIFKFPLFELCEGIDRDLSNRWNLFQAACRDGSDMHSITGFTDSIDFTSHSIAWYYRAVVESIELEGAMRNWNRVLLSIVVLVVFLSMLPAEDNAVIVRSPYYGGTAISASDESILRTYRDQLGLSIDEQTIAGADANQARVLAAISNNSYPVTPGDTLNLFYTEGKNTTSLTLQVDGSYRVVIPTFGTVDGKDKTFVEFAREIERLVLTYLPFSLPRVNLVGTGAFSVTVRGEVESTREVPAWGLSRLSSVVSSATQYASTRQVRVTSADGTGKTYDLYAALREGDLSQNPFVRAGDIVTIPQSGKVVVVAGEVGRPGVYQPLDGESLATILTRYANGVLPSGDSNAVLVRRYGTGTSATIDVVRVSSEELATYTVKHLDTIFVSPIVPISRAVTIEGAVNMGDVQTQSSGLGSSGRVYYQFFPGETVREMLQGIAHRFSAVSDLGATYLLRADRLIPVDVQAILMGNPSEVAKLRLEEGDRFVVPFNQLFVNVTGAVLRPGTFPYIPDKGASYYINMAGGFDPAKNRNGAFTVVDKNGNKVDEEVPVPPEAVVTAKLNTFQAVNGLNLATTVTLVGLVATIVGILYDVVVLSRM